MKKRLHCSAGRRSSGFGPPAAALALLLAALPLTAATTTPYTATGWVIGVPVAGIWCTNGLGQVGFRGNTHLARVESTDARLKGRRTIFVAGAAQTNGSSIIYGPVYHEAGTWDATGTNFTPTGGMWDTTYTGTMGADGSLQLHIVGTGWGGTIDGLRLDENLTRAAGASLDPAIPYLYTGTIKSPPVNTSEVVDNFNDNSYTGSVWGRGSLTESGQQLTARGAFTGVHTASILDSFVFGGYSTTWNVPDGMTREWRVDLVSLDDDSPNTAILVAGTTGSFYAFHKSRNFSFLLKWTSGSGSGAILDCQTAAVRNENVVMTLALSRVPPNLVITTRVLDKADPNTVLYQHSVVDTPSADPSLTVDQFQALTGIRFVDLTLDRAGAPMTSFMAVLGVFQYNDGTQPTPSAVFDNLELRTYEVPPINIARSARLTWPAPAIGSYGVEGAPTVLGPWVPCFEPILATPEVQQMTVPLSNLMKVFRLQAAP